MGGLGHGGGGHGGHGGRGGRGWGGGWGGFDYVVDDPYTVQPVDLQPYGNTVSVTCPSDNPHECATTLRAITQASGGMAGPDPRMQSRRILTRPRRALPTLHAGRAAVQQMVASAHQPLPLRRSRGGFIPGLGALGDPYTMLPPDEGSGGGDAPVLGPPSYLATPPPVLGPPSSLATPPVYGTGPYLGPPSPSAAPAYVPFTVTDTSTVAPAPLGPAGWSATGAPLTPAAAAIGPIQTAPSAAAPASGGAPAAAPGQSFAALMSALSTTTKAVATPVMLAQQAKQTAAQAAQQAAQAQATKTVTEMQSLKAALTKPSNLPLLLIGGGAVVITLIALFRR